MLAHLSVFSTDCATYASHLDIIECRVGNLMARSPGRILSMPSLMAVPHLSHLVGLASPQMSTPTALRGPSSWGDEAGVPAACLVASYWLTPKLWGPHSQFLAVVNTSTSTSTSVCVRVRVRVRVGVCCVPVSTRYIH